MADPVTEFWRYGSSVVKRTNTSAPCSAPSGNHFRRRFASHPLHSQRSRVRVSTFNGRELWRACRKVSHMESGLRNDSAIFGYRARGSESSPVPF